MSFGSIPYWNSHTWKQEIILKPALPGFDRYFKDAPEADDDFKKAWTEGDMISPADMGLSLSDDHLDHVCDASNERGMPNDILNVFENPILIIKIAARKWLNTVKMKSGDKILLYVNYVKKLARGLESISCNVDDIKIPMAAFDGMLPTIEHLNVSLEAFSYDDKLSSSNFGKNQLLQNEKRSKTCDGKPVKDMECFALRPGVPTTNNNCSGRRASDGTRKSKFKCTKSGRFGHTAGHCYR